MATNVTAEIVKDSDNNVFLNCLVENVTGASITTATVTARLLDSADAELSGVSWPVSMPHVSDGNYRGLVPDTLSVEVGQVITIEVTADDGADRKRVFRESTTVQEG